MEPANRFGYGVPFRYPSSGDIGPGLTEDGKRLVAHCDKSGILLDLSHLNEAGFWDVAKQSQNPLVATHSNAYEISPHARNLTDRQLAAIAESDGMVGWAVAFLLPRPDECRYRDRHNVAHLDHHPILAKTGLVWGRILTAPQHLRQLAQRRARPCVPP